MANKDPLTKIKKQINRQTRPVVGKLRVESTGSIFREKPYGTDDTKTANIIWDKAKFTKDRGTSDSEFILKPSNFNGAAYGVQRSTVSTDFGNFYDIEDQYANVRYSGYVFVNRPTTVRFTVKTINGRITIYKDGRQQLLSGQTSGSEYTSDVSFNVTNRSLIQIFWYTEADNATFEMTGYMGKYVDRWEQSDNTPFSMDVVWDATTPISTDVKQDDDNFIPYVTLNWELDDTTGEDNGIGGFGIYRLEFSSIGTVMATDNTEYVDVSGDYCNIDKWVTIGGTVYEIDGVELRGNDTTEFTRILLAETFTASVGDVVEQGKITHKKDIDAGHDLGDLTFSYTDYDVVNGSTYYYLIDTYDDSPNRNRGGMTSDYKSIVAGDATAPGLPVFSSISRVSYDSANVVYYISSYPSDVKVWRLWEDFSTDYPAAIQSGDVNSVVVDDATDLQDNCLVSVNTTSNGKVTRTITVSGTTVTFSTALPSAPDTSSGYVRRMNIIATLPQLPPEGIEGLTIYRTFRVTGLDVPGTYDFWASARDYIGNETLNSLNKSDTLTLSLPSTPSFSNTTHVFSQKSDMVGDPYEEEYKRNFRYN